MKHWTTNRSSGKGQHVDQERAKVIRELQCVYGFSMKHSLKAQRRGQEHHHLMPVIVTGNGIIHILIATSGSGSFSIHPLYELNIVGYCKILQVI